VGSLGRDRCVYPRINLPMLCFIVSLAKSGVSQIKQSLFGTNRQQWALGLCVCDKDGMVEYCKPEWIDTPNFDSTQRQPNLMSYPWPTNFRRRHRIKLGLLSRATKELRVLETHTRACGSSRTLCRKKRLNFCETRNDQQPPKHAGLYPDSISQTVSFITINKV
jgi:hypothetical protein